LTPWATPQQRLPDEGVGIPPIGERQRDVAAPAIVVVVHLDEDVDVMGFRCPASERAEDVYLLD
jgi:hypothetical protein